MKNALLAIIALFFIIIYPVCSADTPESIVVRNGSTITSAEGGIIKIDLPATRGKWPPSISFGAEYGSDKGAKISVSFKAKSSVPVKIRLSISDFAPPLTHFASSQKAELNDNWQELRFDFKLAKIPQDKQRINLPIIVFDEYSGAATVEIREITAEPTASPHKTVSVVPSWSPIDTSELYIMPGSALDLYNIIPRKAAGLKGRLIVNQHGQFAFESEPDVPVRFFSLQLSPYRLLADSNHEQLAEFVAATARQGYNMVRLHFLDDTLRGLRGAALKDIPRYSLPEASADIVFDQEFLDDFFFLAAEFKKHGIYLNLDLLTSFVGYDNGVLHNADKAGDYNTKVQLFVNPMFRNNWLAGVNRLINITNPYTGMSLKDDPALALSTCVNEQEILVSFRDYGSAFHPRWTQWLQQRYGTYQKLHQTWQGQCGKIKLAENGDFSQIPTVSDEAAKDTPAGRDMALFFGEMEEEMSVFFVNGLKALGYRGLYSSWNMRTRMCTVPARSHFPFIIMNGYHAHPRYGKNIFVTQNSSLQWGGSSFNNQAVARFLDRPFVNTEFGLVFWNRFRHEQGLLHGAGAAFQDWSGLTCHTTQVVKVGGPIKCFAAGDDPVIRASELVSAFAFLRGDVKIARHSIELQLDDDYIFSGRGMRAIDSQLSRLWAVCKIGLSYGAKHSDQRPVLSFRPGQSSGVGGGLMFTEVEDSNQYSEINAAITKLKELGALPPENLSNPEKGIFQSDTGEILLDTSVGEMFVAAPRFESAVLKSDKTRKLTSMTITGCNVPAAISLISLDSERAINASSRLLLVFATDARNSNMKFAAPDDTLLREYGTLPIIVRTGKLDVEIATSGTSFRCFPLKLNGKRAGEIPVTYANGKIRLSINTADLKESGPTPFFELVR